MTMRVGAYSADRLTKPWPATVYKALAALHEETGARAAAAPARGSVSRVHARMRVQRTSPGRRLTPGSVAAPRHLLKMITALVLGHQESPHAVTHTQPLPPRQPCQA